MVRDSGCPVHLVEEATRAILRAILALTPHPTE
jgi:hypothetical protein